MTTSIKSGIVFGICALLLVSSFANGQGEEKKKAPSIVGNYTLVGDEGGEEYTGTAKITAHGDAFKVVFTSAEANDAGEKSVETGIGIFGNRTFSVCWVSDADDSKGIAVFRLRRNNKTLAGRWTALGGDGKIYKETLTKVE